MKEKGIFLKIRKIVSKIPRGKVVTYEDVVKALGVKDARIVGWALMENRDPKIPCHRVVKKDGFLAKNYSLEAWKEQKRRLKAEEVHFISKTQVNLKKALLENFLILWT